MDPRTPKHMLRRRILGAAAALPALLAACASMDKDARQRQVASLIGFLFPGAGKPDPANEAVAVLKIPLRVGVAFVPDTASPELRLAEFERLRLSGLVREAFAGLPFIATLDAVPSSYLEPGGGFANLDRVASLLRLDVMALVSYDQVQFAGANRWSFLYWTGIGAYVVEGDQYDILTAVEVAVIDVRSRRMLMHASGSSTVKGEASWINFAERSRVARTESYGTAVQKMVEALKQEVQAFRERAPKDPSIRLELPAGYEAQPIHRP